MPLVWIWQTLDLRHAEDLADLGQRQALVVVEREDEALPLGHPLDGLGQDLT